jgi:hypothetical protein
MLNSTAFTAICTVFTALSTGLSWYTRRTLVANRLTFRVEQLEKDNNQFEATFKTLPHEYIPRNEIVAMLHGINEGIKDIKNYLSWNSHEHREKNPPA